MSDRAAKAAARETLRPHISEWFGHRVFPTVAGHPSAHADQATERCPFRSRVAEKDMDCVKPVNSRGVCTISAGSNGSRQDWLVCPHRALDDDLLYPMVRQLFDLSADADMRILPVTSLGNSLELEELFTTVNNAGAPPQFLTFQQHFGGEISLPRSPANPELSFDLTVVEILPHDGNVIGFQLGRYGVIEIQTTDTHGTYQHAVNALRNARDLHQDDFAEQVAAHPDWPGRRVEGPNISNVFKRTFYQLMFKFQITRRSSSVGCILAIPRPVWDSWQPFLGAPETEELANGSYRLKVSGRTDLEADSQARNWIFVFDIAEEPPSDGSPTAVDIHMRIETDAPTLSKLALDISPSKAIGKEADEDTVLSALKRRVAQYVGGV